MSAINSKVNEMSEELKAIFDYFDDDGDGLITFKELDAMMKSLGKNLPEAQLLDLIEEIDRDGSGTISFDEFQAMAKKFIPDGPDASPQELKEIFEMFDTQCKGYFTSDDLRELTKLMGEEATEEDICEMVQVADADNDGKVSIEDFVTLMSSKNNN